MGYSEGERGREREREGERGRERERERKQNMYTYMYIHLYTHRVKGLKNSLQTIENQMEVHHRLCKGYSDVYTGFRVKGLKTYLDPLCMRRNGHKPNLHEKQPRFSKTNVYEKKTAKRTKTAFFPLRALAPEAKRPQALVFQLRSGL